MISCVPRLPTRSLQRCTRKEGKPGKIHHERDVTLQLVQNTYQYTILNPSWFSISSMRGKLSWSHVLLRSRLVDSSTTAQNSVLRNWIQKFIICVHVTYLHGQECQETWDNPSRWIGSKKMIIMMVPWKHRTLLSINYLRWYNVVL